MSSDHGVVANPKSRRRFIRQLAGMSLLPWISGCGKPDTPLRVAAHPWPGYELLFLADSEGWLNGTGVRMLETASATESMAALAEGRAEVAGLTLDEVLRARAQGIPMQVVLVIDESAGADAFYVRPEIHHISEIAGKRIAVEDSAVGAILLSKVLEVAGLQLSDITQVPLAAHGQSQAWERGEIDAAITYEPVATQLEALGAIRLFDTRSAPDLIIDVLAANREAISRHGHEDQLAALLGGYFRALKHFHANPQDAAYRMAGRLNLSGDEAMEAFRGLRLPDATENWHFLQSGSLLIETARHLNRVLIEKGDLETMDDVSGLLTTDYLP